MPAGVVGPPRVAAVIEVDAMVCSTLPGNGMIWGIRQNSRLPRLGSVQPAAMICFTLGFFALGSFRGGQPQVEMVGAVSVFDPRDRLLVFEACLRRKARAH